MELYGLTRLSLAAVRKEPDQRSEMITQLLFGDPYLVIDQTRDKDWLRINILYDGYEGWISKNQHHGISEEFYQELSKNDYRISTDITSRILYKKRPLNIVIGSILPVSSGEIFDHGEQFAFNGESKDLGQKRDADFLIQVAMKYENVPYLWGGKSPFGIDCSGFVQMIFKISGYPLKRDTKDQVNQGMEVNDIAGINPGDLAFFKNKKGQVTHVGILLGKDKIIHASGLVRIDNFNEKGIFNENTGKQTHTFNSIRRVLK